MVEYNKSGDTYRIVVKEYNTYNTSEDYTLGVKQLNNDIISGGMPDILVVDSNMSMDSYIAKGLVANVDDLIAGDEELSKNDYLQNVWDAYRVDGKLYYVIPSFYISTMVGKNLFSVTVPPLPWKSCRRSGIPCRKEPHSSVILPETASCIP